jgi:hypothetical protein
VTGDRLQEKLIFSISSKGIATKVENSFDVFSAVTGHVSENPLLYIEQQLRSKPRPLAIFLTS